MWLKLLHHLVRVVDQREPGALATTILRPEAEDGDLVFAGFIELGEFSSEFVFRNVGAVGVEDVTGAKNISKRALSKDIGYKRAKREVCRRTRPSAFFLGGHCE